MADIIYESDDILHKYQQLKAINAQLQEKLQAFEQEVSRVKDPGEASPEPQDDEADLTDIKPVDQ